MRGSIFYLITEMRTIMSMKSGRRRLLWGPGRDAFARRQSLFALVAGVGILALACVAQAQEKYIAYVVPTGTVGNQAFGGVLGMDFEVNNPVLITKLGVFDDNSDGLQLTITAKLWDRLDQTKIVAVDFTPEDPGELIGGSRFKTLPQPVSLEIGFQGVITAEGYGADERHRNRLADPANVVWTTQDGNGSLQFVGTSRFGVRSGEFPDTADGGPAARYAAGTFEFQTTPALLPGKPAVTLKPGDGRVSVSWLPITSPLAAAKYRVFRGAMSAGVLALTQIAETAETNLVDAPLPNGTPVYYAVRAVSAGGKEGPDSDIKCTVPYVLEANHQIAYFTPAASGNQAFGGSLGVDFDLDNPILVKRLGVFDDGADGLNLPLTARIWDRQTEQVIVEVAFAEGEGDLIEGMRFKPLDAPLRLETGFRGVIQADGYGLGERLLNSEGDTNAIIWTLNDGNGSLRFIGTSRYATAAGVFPNQPDRGPAARFSAGTFEFEVLPPERPGTPQVQVLTPFEDGAATLSWLPVTKPLPAIQYRVLRGSAADGPFTHIATVDATNHRDAGLVNGIEVFYVVRSVASGGAMSGDSYPVRALPTARLAGVAYINAAGTEGNQTFGGSLGMDFDVSRPVRVTRLGVFDDLSDGLNLPLTAVLYNRTTHEALATVVFTPEDPGELVNGSRFKALAQAVSLAADFEGTIAASGYGEGERFLNSEGQVRPELGTFDGASLIFVGSSRYGIPGEFPGNADTGPANRYAAGTFYFEPLAEVVPPVLTIQLLGGKVRLTWSGGGTLRDAPEVAGPWNVVPGAVSGIEIAPSAARRFYRVYH